MTSLRASHLASTSIAQQLLNVYVEGGFELNLRVMDFDHFDSLRRYPLHKDALSDEYSDFPPIRERKSTPNPVTGTSRFYHRSSAVQHSEPRSSPELEVQSPPPPNKGLNVLNTIKVSVKTQSFQQTSESS